ncbi:ScpA family protein [Acetobacteraceae bacterium ESL0709]|nr:ScpA family protein [Acetobacteraceae bacterium ESL0697]MDF7677680.1 ScpA family protein [Acetobacteraceae bacterium ESL0709]
MEALHLRLEGYEGPLDLLLELARQQKIDLAHISILHLAEQFLAVVEGARDEAHHFDLEVTADWLVMTAWLTWLKSRLLVASPEPEVEEAADLLQGRLIELERMREAVRWLEERPRLGRDVFERPVAEEYVEIDRSRLKADLSSLIKAYLSARRHRQRKQVYRPRKRHYWSVREARDILSRLLGQEISRKWQSLTLLLPALEKENEIEAKATIAGVFLAGLEMAKGGHVELRQACAFTAIEWRGRGHV